MRDLLLSTMTVILFAVSCGKKKPNHDGEAFLNGADLAGIEESFGALELMGAVEGEDRRKEKFKQLRSHLSSEAAQVFDKAVEKQKKLREEAAAICPPNPEIKKFWQERLSIQKKDQSIDEKKKSLKALREKYDVPLLQRKNRNDRLACIGKNSDKMGKILVTQKLLKGFCLPGKGKKLLKAGVLGKTKFSKERLSGDVLGKPDKRKNLKKEFVKKMRKKILSRMEEALKSPECLGVVEPPTK